MAPSTSGAGPPAEQGSVREGSRIRGQEGAEVPHPHRGSGHGLIVLVEDASVQLARHVHPEHPGFGPRHTRAQLRAQQRELRTQHERLDTVIRTLRDGLVVLDADGSPVLGNRAAKPLMAMTFRRFTKSRYKILKSIKS